MEQVGMNEEELKAHMRDWARFLYKLYKDKKVRDLVIAKDDDVCQKS